MNSQKDATPSAFTKMRQVYWEAKQSFNKSLGQREDSCIISSDSELDIKLELLKAADNYFNVLMSVLLQYRDALEDLVSIQDDFGLTLINYGTKNSTAAGKIMCMSGRTISKTAQKQSQIKTSLMNLFYEVQTFQFKATADALQSVAKMEKVRKSYRSGLMWLKNESAGVDPDVTKKMKNFRKVQEHVKRLKVRFDDAKLKCMQKIDLFLLSRSNLFSHTIVPYIKIFKKTARNSALLMNSTLKNIPLCSSYNFVKLKELNRYSKVFQTTLQQVSSDAMSRKQKSKKTKENAKAGAYLDSIPLTTDSKPFNNNESNPSEANDSRNMLLIDLSGDRNKNRLLTDSLHEDHSQQPFPKYSDDLMSLHFEHYRASSFGSELSINFENDFGKSLLDSASPETACKESDNLHFWSLIQNLEQTSNMSQKNNPDIMDSAIFSGRQSSDILLQSKWYEILVQFDPFSDEKSKCQTKTETLEC